MPCTLCCWLLLAVTGCRSGWRNAAGGESQGGTAGRGLYDFTTERQTATRLGKQRGWCEKRLTSMTKVVYKVGGCLLLMRGGRLKSRGRRRRPRKRGKAAPVMPDFRQSQPHAVYLHFSKQTRPLRARHNTMTTAPKSGLSRLFFSFPSVGPASHPSNQGMRTSIKNTPASVAGYTLCIPVVPT